MRKIFANVIFIFVALFLQATVLEIESLPGPRPDFLLIVLSWFVLSSETHEAAGYGFLLGFIQDTFSGGAMGLNALAKMGIGLLNSALRRSIIIDNPANRMILVIVNTFVQALLIGMVAWGFSLGLILDDIMDRGLFYQMIANGIISIPIMWLMDKVTVSPDRYR